MTKPLVGISSNETRVSDQLDIIHLSSSRNFAEGIQAAGGLPFYIPISSPDLAAAYVESIDKLLLTGGQHILPAWYGQEKEIDSQDYHENRDRFELALIEAALAQDKPIFAVCRGLQLYNAYQGGSLNQDIAGHTGSPLDLAHSVRMDPNSRLGSIFGQMRPINSVHRQSIRILGKNLKAVGYSFDDGVIEAVESTDSSRFFGVQWHPEFLLTNRPENQALFDYFVQQL